MDTKLVNNDNHSKAKQKEKRKRKRDRDSKETKELKETKEGKTHKNNHNKQFPLDPQFRRAEDNSMSNQVDTSKRKSKDKERKKSKRAKLGTEYASVDDVIHKLEQLADPDEDKEYEETLNQLEAIRIHPGIPAGVNVERFFMVDKKLSEAEFEHYLDELEKQHQQVQREGKALFVNPLTSALLSMPNLPKDPKNPSAPTTFTFPRSLLPLPETLQDTRSTLDGLREIDHTPEFCFRVKNPKKYRSK
jgi:hypothetical protein